MSTHPPLQNGLLDGKPAGEASAGTRAAGSPRRGARGGPPSKVTEDEGAAADRRRQGGPRSRPGGSLRPELSWKGLSQAPFPEGAERPGGVLRKGRGLRGRGCDGGGAQGGEGARGRKGRGSERLRTPRGRLGPALPWGPGRRVRGASRHRLSSPARNLSASPGLRVATPRPSPHLGSSRLSPTPAPTPAPSQLCPYL